jgi:hypothetical protein
MDLRRDLRFVGNQGQEVQAEFGLGEILLLQQGETQHAGVEIQRLLQILHADHGVVVDEVGGGSVGLGGHAGNGVELVEGHGVLHQAGKRLYLPRWPRKALFSRVRR